MIELFRRTFAEINLDHLAHNFFQIKKLCNNDRFLCPMVKANAYGHGDAEVSKALDSWGATHLGVCLIEEGLILKKQNLKSEILIFRGFDKQGAQKIFDARLTPVVSTWDQIFNLESVADEPISVHIKFNTGMNRLGFDIQDAEKIKDYFLHQSKNLKLKAILSHFYCGEDSIDENGNSSKQASQLEKIFNEYRHFFRQDSLHVHLLNSGGIIGLSEVSKKPEHYLNSLPWGLRPGLILYGYSPSPQYKSLDLKPVMSLKSVINNIRFIKKNESVSYGATWIASDDSSVAIVPIGYADGVHRVISNQFSVLVCGMRAPVIGQICMDFLMIDVTEILKHFSYDKLIHEEVILFGFDSSKNLLSAEVMAEKAKTITWEVLTSVGERVPRYFKGGQK